MEGFPTASLIATSLRGIPDMSLKTKQILEAQKRRYEKALSERQALLVERGLEKEAILRDARLKSLKGKLKQVHGRSRAVSKIEKTYDDMRKRKEEPLPKPTPQKGMMKKKKMKDRGKGNGGQAQAERVETE